ncbi:ABC transporter substrate-binding protein [Chthonobacter albigriseus]|uniref:ABC transporter substrate-binding protein n=1 Tax=Chthonobacter albigriseus TaxID=1683161 RepID=UPI0015EE7966|nr:ABC transporter substrate-binding protein [Chthonobacter albigriseus]
MKRSRPSLARPTITALTLALTTFALGAGEATAETQVRVAMTAADIPDWTGAPDQGYEGFRFAGFTIYDSLVNWDLSSSEKAADITPGLAESWEIDPADHKRWIFKLRQGVKFHDGCDWNADAALWNFARIKDDKAPQHNVRHQTMQGWTISNVESMAKIDDYTISLTTKIVDSLIAYQLAGYFQISPCAMQAVNNNYDEFAKKPSGTGPYKFDKVVPRERLELVKNAEYWNPKRVPKHDRLVLLPMPEATTRAAALLAGQVDFVEAPSPDTIPRLKDAGMNIVLVPYPHNWDYQVRVDMPPFDDVRVRRAANYAINRAEMVEMLQGIAMEGYAKFIPSQTYYGNPVKYEYDPEKASALLEEAGCKPCQVTIAISTSGSGQMQPLPMNELVKEQLEAVGFEVQLDPIDWNALLGVYFGGAKAFPQYHGVNVSLSSIEPVQAIMKNSMTRYQPPNGLNWGFFSDPETDALGEAALNEFDAEKRLALIQKMHERLVDQAYEIFIAHDLNPRALSPKLKGFVQAQSWFQDLTPIEVVE